MQKRLLFTLLLLAAFLSRAVAQQWGYVTLIATQNATTATLIDTNNTVVKQWTGLTGQTGYSSYMMPGGELWRTVKASGTSFNGGGICGRVQKVSWTGAILFDYEINSTDECSHHDICPLANGNVLMIAYEKKTAAEVQAAGCTANAIRWSEVIYELHPTGVNSADIVWEWHLWDHLVQNVNASLPNYQTSIVNHPELLNVNYQNTATDWVHMNGIDYNATLDQIVVSSHNLNELWVIDHSTSTAQAATHTGGSSGKGGDFLYRWGNPAAYSASGTAVFNVVHDAHWVPYDCPRAGWLGGFNNKGVSASISSIDLFQPPWNGSSYTITPGQAYTPSTYGYRHQASGFSSNMGNSQQLPNGNMLVCLATASKVYEINAAGTQLWQYTTNGTVPQAWRYTRCYMENPEIDVATANPVLCTGGSVQLDINPTASGTSTFTYSWSPGTGLSSTTVQDPVVSNLNNSTTYTVTVTTAGGCSVTATIPVSVLPSITANAGNNVTISAGQTTTLTASGGGTYSWSNGATTASTTVAPTSTTTYTVTVTGANGCTATDEVTVTVSSTPTSVTISAFPTAVCLGNSTQLQANASGGTGNYTYSWSSTPAGFSSNISDPEVTPLVNTTYKVTVSDGLTTSTASVAITVLPLPNANAGNNQTILLGNSATLTASGGGTYLWDTGATTASITVSPTATTIYDVTVTGVNGCTKTDDVTVTVTIPPTTVSVSASANSLCAGEGTQLFANAGGGTGNYTYTWSSTPSGFSSASSMPMVTPSVTTTYKVTVTDGISSATGTVVVVVSPVPNANAGNNVTIIAGQSATLTATGGISYLWDTGNPTASITVSPTETTTYNVTVTGNGSCTDEDDVIVTVTPAASVTASAALSAFCAGGSTQLSALATGGTGNYTYAWTSVPAGFTSSLSNPVVTPSATTSYTVVVTDGVGSTTANVGVTVYSLPVADAGVNVSVVFGQPAALSATGGGSYIWSNGVTTAVNTVLPVFTTTYTVTVTNVSGCTDSDDVTVTVTGSALSALASATNSIVCWGDSTQLSAVASGGSGNYTYAWTSMPTGFVSALAQPRVAPQENTVYQVTISDGFNTTTATTAVNVNPVPTAGAGDDISIQIGTSATLSATGGVSFSWSTGAVTADITVAPVTNTTYTVTVTDANGCTDTDEVLVTVTGQPLSGSLNAASNAICVGQSTTLQAMPVGGSGNYTYTWESEPAGFTFGGSAPVVTPTTTTTYSVTIFDGNVSVSTSTAIVVNTLPVAFAGVDTYIIAGQSTLLQATGGGDYMWSNGALVPTVTVSPLSTTTYTVTVTSLAGCTATDEVVITVGPSLSASATSSLSAFCEGASVQLAAMGTGGTGNYTYFWTSIPEGFTSASSTPTVSPSENTIYTVVIEDGLSSASASVYLTVYPVPLAYAGADATINAGESVTLSAIGGGFYSWSNGASTANVTVSPVLTTTYTVTVTSIDGCQASDDVLVTVIQSLPLMASIAATDTVICDGDIVQLFANAAEGTGNYTYEWSSDPAGFSSTLPDPYINPNVTTTYTVIVQDGNSSVTLNFVVTVNPLPAQPTITPVGITLVSSSPTNNQWFYYGNPVPDATGQVFTPGQDGSYQVQTMDANGCFSPLSDPFEYTITGVDNLTNGLWWNIAPNPASQVVHISGNIPVEQLNITVWSASGVLVTATQNTTVIPVGNLPAGIYQIRMTAGSSIGVRKLVIVR